METVGSGWRERPKRDKEEQKGQEQEKRGKVERKGKKGRTTEEGRRWIGVFLSGSPGL